MMVVCIRVLAEEMVSGNGSSEYILKRRVVKIVEGVDC